jgi:hypothetical protein
MNSKDTFINETLRLSKTLVKNLNRRLSLLTLSTLLIFNTIPLNAQNTAPNNPDTILSEYQSSLSEQELEARLKQLEQREIELRELLGEETARKVINGLKNLPADPNTKVQTLEEQHRELVDQGFLSDETKEKLESYQNYVVAAAALTATGFAINMVRKKLAAAKRARLETKPQGLSELIENRENARTNLALERQKAHALYLQAQKELEHRKQIAVEFKRINEYLERLNSIDADLTKINEEIKNKGWSEHRENIREPLIEKKMAAVKELADHYNKMGARTPGQFFARIFPSNLSHNSRLRRQERDLHNITDQMNANESAERQRARIQLGTIESEHTADLEALADKQIKLHDDLIEHVSGATEQISPNRNTGGVGAQQVPDAKRGVTRSSALKIIETLDLLKVSEGVVAVADPLDQLKLHEEAIVTAEAKLDHTELQVQREELKKSGDLKKTAGLSERPVHVVNGPSRPSVVDLSGETGAGNERAIEEIRVSSSDDIPLVTDSLGQRFLSNGVTVKPYEPETKLSLTVATKKFNEGHISEEVFRLIIDREQKKLNQSIDQSLRDSASPKPTQAITERSENLAKALRTYSLKTGQKAALGGHYNNRDKDYYQKVATIEGKNTETLESNISILDDSINEKRQELDELQSKRFQRPYQKKIEALLADISRLEFTRAQQSESLERSQEKLKQAKDSIRNIEDALLDMDHLERMALQSYEEIMSPEMRMIELWANFYQVEDEIRALKELNEKLLKAQKEHKKFGRNKETVTIDGRRVSKEFVDAEIARTQTTLEEKRKQLSNLTTYIEQQNSPSHRKKRAAYMAQAEQTTNKVWQGHINRQEQARMLVETDLKQAKETITHSEEQIDKLDAKTKHLQTEISQAEKELASLRKPTKLGDRIRGNQLERLRLNISNNVDEIRELNPTRKNLIARKERKLSADIKRHENLYKKQKAAEAEQARRNKAKIDAQKAKLAQLNGDLKSAAEETEKFLTAKNEATAARDHLKTELEDIKTTQSKQHKRTAGNIQHEMAKRGHDIVLSELNSQELAEELAREKARLKLATSFSDTNKANFILISNQRIGEIKRRQQQLQAEAKAVIAATHEAASQRALAARESISGIPFDPEEPNPTKVGLSQKLLSIEHEIVEQKAIHQDLLLQKEQLNAQLEEAKKLPALLAENSQEMERAKGTDSHHKERQKELLVQRQALEEQQRKAALIPGQIKRIDHNIAQVDESSEKSQKLNEQRNVLLAELNTASDNYADRVRFLHLNPMSMARVTDSLSEAESHRVYMATMEDEVKKHQAAIERLKKEATKAQILDPHGQKLKKERFGLIDSLKALKTRLTEIEAELDKFTTSSTRDRNFGKQRSLILAIEKKVAALEKVNAEIDSKKAGIKAILADITLQVEAHERVAESLIAQAEKSSSSNFIWNQEQLKVQEEVLRLRDELKETSLKFDKAMEAFQQDQENSDKQQAALELAEEKSNLESHLEKAERTADTTQTAFTEKHDNTPKDVIVRRLGGGLVEASVTDDSGKTLSATVNEKSLQTHSSEAEVVEVFRPAHTQDVIAARELTETSDADQRPLLTGNASDFETTDVRNSVEPTSVQERSAERKIEKAKARAFRSAKLRHMEALADYCIGK